MHEIKTWTATTLALAGLVGCTPEINIIGGSPELPTAYSTPMPQGPPPPPSWNVAPQPESCNGFDDDLDGQVDESCSCTPGQTAECFPGPQSGVRGACRAGTMACSGSGEFATWGQCTGAIVPVAETCGDGIDQDCDGADLPCPPQQLCEQYVVGQTSRPVDILFVIDQSLSMEEEIDAVRQQMNTFAQTIAASQVDYHVVVLARRTRDYSSSSYFDDYYVCIAPPLAGPSCGDGPRFRQVDEEVGSHDALELVAQNMGAIESFMRPDSVRHIIAITDDESDMYADDFQGLLANRPGWAGYAFHSVVATSDASSCGAGTGSTYLDLSRWTKGLIFDICQANWSSLFSVLAKNVSEAATRFSLSRQPQTGSINVKVGGLPHGAWRYNQATNDVQLTDQPPVAPGSAIEVCYLVP